MAILGFEIHAHCYVNKWSKEVWRNWGVAAGIISRWLSLENLHVFNGNLQCLYVGETGRLAGLRSKKVLLGTDLFVLLFVCVEKCDKPTTAALKLDLCRLERKLLKCRINEVQSHQETIDIGQCVFQIFLHLIYFLNFPLRNVLVSFFPILFVHSPSHLGLHSLSSLQVSIDHIWDG